jgi:hypothetical protein
MSRRYVCHIFVFGVWVWPSAVRKTESCADSLSKRKNNQTIYLMYQYEFHRLDDKPNSGSPVLHLWGRLSYIFLGNTNSNIINVISVGLHDFKTSYFTVGVAAYFDRGGHPQTSQSQQDI